MELLTQPWPWYVAGPLIGLIVPLLLFLGNKQFGVSSSLRDMCAACLPVKTEFLNYDWKKHGKWNLYFVGGIFFGGFLGGFVFQNPEPVAISARTISDLSALGISDFSGFIPDDIFSWSALPSLHGIIFLAIGGFLVGFGTRYAGGCTSGHTISGISNLQLASVIASAAFFAGGLIMTHLLFPLIF